MNREISLIAYSSSLMADPTPVAKRFARGGNRGRTEVNHTFLAALFRFGGEQRRFHLRVALGDAGFPFDFLSFEIPHLLGLQLLGTRFHRLRVHLLLLSHLPRRD